MPLEMRRWLWGRPSGLFVQVQANLYNLVGDALLEGAVKDMVAIAIASLRMNSKVAYNNDAKTCKVVNTSPTHHGKASSWIHFKYANKPDFQQCLSPYAYRSRLGRFLKYCGQSMPPTVSHRRREQWSHETKINGNLKEFLPVYKSAGASLT